LKLLIGQRDEAYFKTILSGANAVSHFVRAGFRSSITLFYPRFEIAFLKWLCYLLQQNAAWLF